MKQILTLLFAVAILVQANAQEKAPFVKVGDSLPAFSFEIEKGKKVNISDYQGKLILINFFATWCPPCRAELPEIQSQIWEKYGKNEKFAFFVFGREEGWDVLLPFKKKFNYTFPILPDVDRGVFSKFAEAYIPRNFLIDENGKIIYESTGFEKEEFEALVQLIKKKLEK